jgi:uncharacterized metal-binding protein YceD (DUF177 family)
VDLDDLRQARALTHELRSTLARSWLQQSLGHEDATVALPGAVQLELSIQGSGAVLVRGRIEATFEVPCARCLAPATVDAGTAVCATYVPESDGIGQAADDEAPLDPDDLERMIFDGRHLDLRPMLAELVALAYPMRALCPRGEQCRGLCGGCGADLNLQADAAECAECGRANHGPAGGSEGESAQNGQDTAWRAALRKLRDE